MTIIDRAPPAPTPPRTGSDFAELTRRVSAAGLFDRRPGYYVVRLGLVATLFAGGWVAFAALGDSWWQLLLAVFFAVLFGQIALVAHDLAHRQVFRTRRPSGITGRLAGNLGIGMSYGWWMDKHTRHHANPNHANPNHADLDPDVEPDVLVWSTDQARASRGLPRFLGRWQAFLFFPLLTLEGLNLHYSSVRALFRPTMRRRGLEATLLLLHVVGYLGALFLVLSPGKALVFLAVHQGLWGVYMGSIFAPGHKGMSMIEPGQKLDFLRRQVLTSRNVRGSRFVDVAMGGLNYQIEHHLFPHLPTPHLRRARPIVRGYCAELSLRYHETGLLRSWAEALGHLHRAGAPLRAAG
ncbi:Fatty acid desaturase [Amycolatopsis arida]|uniref:Fatty acid desaturase n=1 Tax=Amycolatopsis arida TaxID=587909 RepID=A0A1I5TX71_9PSEU|nr:acyl-CoA desaturase [Amycolatopsis arida]TDX95933.1 fatty acid desaturase [Amycolatopsis arida]SFP87491.1 Fatty acid desaturase [Amycolatopsis arida]